MNNTKVIALITSLACAGSAYATVAVPPSVNGEISNLAELRWLSETPSAWGENWKLTADIDAADTATWNVGDHDADGGTPDEAMGFAGIGQDAVGAFAGTFDGQGFTISNLYINRPTEDRLGLFGKIESANIKNLVLDSPSITGKLSLGAVAGSAEWDARFENIEVKNATVSTVNWFGAPAGGAIGRLGYGSIAKNLTVEATVNAPDISSVGGVVGELVWRSELIDITVNSNVTGDRAVGGIVGETNQGFITNATVEAIVNGERYVAGGIGLDQSSRHQNISIKDSTINAPTTSYSESNAGGFTGECWQGTYSDITVSGVTIVADKRNAGGLCGYIGSSSFTNADVQASVTGDYYVGGIGGSNYNFMSFDGITFVGDVTATTTTVEADVGGFLGLGADFSASNIDVDATVTASQTRAGGLIGSVYNSGGLYDVTVKATVSGTDEVGGAVGTSSGLHAERVVVDSGTVVNGQSNVGGLIGWSELTNIVDSSSTAQVDATGTNVGGVVGQAAGLLILDSYFDGAVKGVAQVGGIVGYAQSGMGPTLLTSVYSLATIEADNTVGGLVGASNTDQTFIYEAYAASPITANSAIGAITGDQTNIFISDTYYDSELTGLGTVDGVAKTTAEMQSVATFSHWSKPDAWNNGVWYLNDGEYPRLVQGVLPVFHSPTEAEGAVPAQTLMPGETKFVWVRASDPSLVLNGEVTYAFVGAVPDFVTFGLGGVYMSPTQSDAGFHTVTVEAQLDGRSNQLPPFTIQVLNPNSATPDQMPEANKPQSGEKVDSSSGGSMGWLWVAMLSGLLLVRKSTRG